MMTKKDEINKLLDTIKTDFPDGCRGVECKDCPLDDYSIWTLNEKLCDVLSMLESQAQHKTKDVCMTLHRWNNYELSGYPIGSFDGYNDGSIGFMPVYDDGDKLKEKYPDVEIMKIERVE